MSSSSPTSTACATGPEHPVPGERRAERADGSARRAASDAPRSILVTGAAAGIGAMVAGSFVARGFRVFGTVDPRRWSGRPEGVTWVGGDVTSEDAARRAIDAVLVRSRRLDAVVCGAGLGTFGQGGDVSIGAAFRQFEANFVATLRTLRAVLPQLCRQRSGRVVLLGAVAGRAPVPFQVHYTAAKAAVEGLAASLRRELRHFGVQVTLVTSTDLDIPFDCAMDPRDGVPHVRGTAERDADAHEGLDSLAAAIEAAVCARRARGRYRARPEPSTRTRLAQLFTGWRLPGRSFAG